MKKIATAWDERYKTEEFVYGLESNLYLKDQLENILPGKILFPAEGEGRNAVYAATKGWDVYAFDISEVGAKKANSLAKNKNVLINYQVGNLSNFDFEESQFDVIALIFAHFGGENRTELHQELTKLLKKGGTVILEAFSKKQIEYQAKNPLSGGPRNLDMLFSVEEIKADFPDFKIIELAEKEVELKEGSFHVGRASVIRFIGIKTS